MAKKSKKSIEAQEVADLEARAQAAASSVEISAESTEFVFAEGMNEPVESPVEPAEPAISKETAQKMQAAILSKHPLTEESEAEYPNVQNELPRKRIIARAVTLGRQLELSELCGKDDSVIRPELLKCASTIQDGETPCGKDVDPRWFAKLDTDGSAKYVGNSDRLEERGPFLVVKGDVEQSIRFGIEGYCTECRQTLENAKRMKNAKVAKAAKDAGREPKKEEFQSLRWQSYRQARVFVNRKNDEIGRLRAERAKEEAERRKKLARASEALERLSSPYPSTERGKSRKEMNAKRGQ